MKGNGKESSKSQTRWRRKKEKGSWNYNRTLKCKRAIISYQCLRRDRERNENGIWPTMKNRVLILKEKNYLAVDSQCTNRTGTILIYSLLWVVSKHRCYCIYLVEHYQATNSTMKFRVNILRQSLEEKPNWVCNTVIYVSVPRDTI